MIITSTSSIVLYSRKNFARLKREFQKINVLNTVGFFVACDCTDIFTRSLIGLPDSKFEPEPRVFPLVSGNVFVGTAFILKVPNSKSHVVSWSSKPQPKLHNDC